MANKPLLGVVAGIIVVASIGSYLAIDTLPSWNPTAEAKQDAPPPQQGDAAPIGSTAPAVVSPATESAGPIAMAATSDDQGNWLVGTWGPSEGHADNNPNQPCETDATITFNADGTYQEGGEEEGDGGPTGRWTLTGNDLIYRANSGEISRSRLKQIGKFALIETGYKGSGASKLVQCSIQ